MDAPAQTGRNRRGATTTQSAERSAGSTAIRVLVKADEIMPQARTSPHLETRCTLAPASSSSSAACVWLRKHAIISLRSMLHSPWVPLPGALCLPAHCSYLHEWRYRT
jgi:hypothetical protein